MRRSIRSWRRRSRRTAPARPQRKQPAAPDGATRMLSPEESQAASREAMAKLQGARAMPDSAEDRLSELESLWYEVVEAVCAGRTQGLVCPECRLEGLVVEERQGHTT